MEGYVNVKSDFYNGGGAVSGVLTSGTALQQKDTPPMEMVLRTLAERAERLAQTVQHVEQRFCTVVRPEPPSPATTGREARPTRSVSSLGSMIEQHTQQIEALTERLSSLLQRCEL